MRTSKQISFNEETLNTSEAVLIVSSLVALLATLIAFSYCI